MSGERTERATPKRREEARKRGQIARRPEFAAAIAFLAALAALRATGDGLSQRAANLFINNTRLVERAAASPFSINDLHQIVIDALTDLALLAAPAIAAALAGGIAGNVVQGGWLFAPEALKIRAESFNPYANLRRTFSNAPFEALKSVLKLIALGSISYLILAQTIAHVAELVGSPAAQTLAKLGSSAFDFALRAGLAMLILAALDYGYGWLKHERSLRMTKQELKDELREQEGDPLIKGQRRRAARALLQKRIAVEVPRADVVVVNPQHYAVALRYDRTRDAAPVVVAKGVDYLAQRIRQIARAHSVAIIENPPLARALYRAVDVGRMIPPEFFRAVAEVLAYVYRQRKAQPPAE